MPDHETDPHETRMISDGSLKQRSVQKIKACQTTVCWYGEPIRGLLQSGHYVFIVHDAGVTHSCSFRGTITPEMDRYYNHAQTS